MHRPAASTSSRQRCKRFYDGTHKNANMMSKKGLKKISELIALIARYHSLALMKEAKCQEVLSNSKEGRLARR